MRSIIINNEFVNGVKLELGKKYRLADDFYGDLEGTLVNINEYYVCTDPNISVHEELNITLRMDNSWDDRNILVDFICHVEEIA